MASPVGRSVFGSLLRRHRLAAGLTQAALAERAGLAERTVQDLERGVARPLRETVRRLVAALEPTPEACARFEAAIFAPRRTGLTPRVLAGDGASRVERDVEWDVPSPRFLGVRPHNLPLQTTPLLGRDQDVRAVTGLLLRDDVRLVTLTGAGGSGKTRLGVQVAADLLDRFEDGAFFVDLAPITDPALVASTIALVLGVQADRGRPLLDVLVDSLHGRQLLLVLDNFEQVLAAATVPDTLARTCPRLCVLVTSRAALQLRSEHEYLVSPLELPDPTRSFTPEALSQYGAVALFIERATAIKPDFALSNANAPAVAEICARLDGLPLAIELAAARIRVLTPEAILSRLGHGLALLSGGRRDLPARQQTLRGAIAWSYDLLPAAEQRLFRRLSVFVGRFTLDAAEAVCGADGDLDVDVFEGVAALVDNNLVRSDEQLVGEPRFSMLETIREFGLERLAAADEEASVRRRHLDWFADFTERCQPGVFGPDGPAWLDRMAAELDNMRAAMDWSVIDPSPGSARAGLRIAGAAQQLWLWRDNLTEGQRWLEQTLAADETRSPTDGPNMTLPAARLGAHGVNPRVVALNALSILRRTPGGLAEAEISASQALVLARTLQDRTGEAHALVSLGMIAGGQGALKRAAALLEESLAIARRVGDQFASWRALSQLGDILRRLGQPERARPMQGEALTIARAWGNLWNSAQSLEYLAQLAFDQGKVDRVTALVEESLALLSKIGDDRDYRGSVWRLGTMALAMDDPRRAAERFAESLTLSLQASRRGELTRCVEGLVAASRLAGPGGTGTQSPTTGARLLGAAASLREETGRPMSLAERALFERAEAMVRANLGDDAYDVAFAEGRAMPMEQAIERALDLANEILASSP